MNINSRDPNKATHLKYNKHIKQIMASQAFGCQSQENKAHIVDVEQQAFLLYALNDYST